MTLKKVFKKDGTFTYHTLAFYKGQRSTQRTTYTSNEREAARIDRDRQREFELDVEERLLGRAALTPLSIDLIATWKKQQGKDMELHEQYATGDTERYFRHLSCFDWKFERVTVEERWAYIRKRRKQLTKSGRPPFYRSLKRELYVLNWGLKRAKKLGYPVEVDLEMPKLPEERKDEKQSGHMITVHEFTEWRKQLPAREADQVLVQVLTGLRWGELRKFEPTFLRTHCEAPTLGVVAYADLPIDVCIRQRTIALTQAAYDALRRILPVPAGQKNPAFQRAAEAAGLSRAPHERDLRTTFANMAAIHGGDSKGVDLVLGHRDPTSGRHYQQAYDRRLARIALTLASQFYPVSSDQHTSEKCPLCNGSGIRPDAGEE